MNMCLYVGCGVKACTPGCGPGSESSILFSQPKYGRVAQ